MGQRAAQNQTPKEESNSIKKNQYSICYKLQNTYQTEETFYKEKTYIYASFSIFSKIRSSVIHFRAVFPFQPCMIDDIMIALSKLI